MEEKSRNILIRYIAGKASAKEIAMAKEWIAASEEHELAYIQLYEKWHRGLATYHKCIDTEKAYRRFMTENNAVGSCRRNRQLLLYAASTLLIISVGLTFFLLRNKSQWHEVVVAKGQTKEIKLPDGTLVFINAGSRLAYNKEFGRAERSVVLNGEARFDIVESKNDIPFIVKAGGFTVRDIGTVFTVKAYAEDKVFESVVLEGKISVEGRLPGNEDGNKKVFVAANQVLRIKHVGDAVVDRAPKKGKLVERLSPVQLMDVTTDKQKVYNGWMNNIVAFDDTSFDDICRILGRKFNVKIHLDNEELAAYHYTGMFKNPKGIDEILAIIKKTTPITYQITEKDIFIKKEPY
ncbi:FecR family protein [Olivibacter domesticus]|uniref:FecR family protein n=1 Tax=Olivibacter domesticus TaxID=407022 RepID=A0A1H7RD94_OLID1|nr:FecR domain-containing protein [Olivibacter domesticus]SEL57407.1 FecR family protein [Olivibacter domesticus]